MGPKKCFLWKRKDNDVKIQQVVADSSAGPLLCHNNIMKYFFNLFKKSKEIKYCC